MEVLKIQFIEELNQVVVATLRGTDSLASSCLFYVGQRAPNIGAVQVAAVASEYPGIERFPVEFSKKNVGERLLNGGRGSFKEIAYVDGQPVFSQADAAIGVGILAKPDDNAGYWSARSESFENTRVNLLDRFKE